MNITQAELLKNSLGIDLTMAQIELFNKYEKIFLEKNSLTNLISKNDEKFLFEKHIFDSLAINKFFKKQKSDKLKRLLDMGTGGGFPSVPISLLYDNINVSAIDSTRKKINVIESIKEELDLKNLFPICERIENLQSKNHPKSFDYVTSRALASMDTLLKYALPNLKDGGYFIAYKSKKAVDELKEAEATFKLLKAKVVDIIDYTLPLEEVYQRSLIVIKKGK